MSAPQTGARRGITAWRVMLWLFGPAFVALMLTVWGIHLGTRHGPQVRLFEWRFFNVGEPPPQLAEPQPSIAEGAGPSVSPGYGGHLDPPSWGPPLPTVTAPVPAGVGTVGPPDPDPETWPGAPMAYGPPGPAPAPAPPAGSAAVHEPVPTAPAPTPSWPAPSAAQTSAPAVGSHWTPLPAPVAPQPVPVAPPPATALSPALPAPSVHRPGGHVPGEPGANEPSAAQMAMPVVVRVKVLLDDRLATSHPDWLARVQGELAAASQVYRDGFAITLSLVGVVRWSGARAGALPAAAFADLRAHSREGADVVLGWLATELPMDAYGYGAPASGSSYHGVYGLVGLSPGADGTYSHHRGLLRSLAALLGALPVRDPQSHAYQLGSWMSEAPVPSGRPPWIDVDNRRRILLRKGLPFADTVSAGGKDR